ncbi:hypothetical protein GCM10022217_30270 [Chryseobacterium ginsenosidimutans]|uniref:hypothetical protein n=1 Tax=Chryseobacterium ginsenosidimutans TaxID=687846 RepID=UPI0031DD5BAF
MKKLLFILVFITSFLKSQVIKDTVLGKPKSVKEYAVFLNNSGPFTFMSGDNEYGHAVRMIPKNLRSRMSGVWFETNFCRYINNETFYDKNRNITKETWYYRSGAIVGDYNYTYDNLGRLVNEKSNSKYSTANKKYIYKSSSKKLKFIENRSKWENEPDKIYFNNREDDAPLMVTKFDALSKTDSIFAITDFVWKKIEENSFQKGNDSIFRKKLYQVNFYDEEFQIKESKFFDYQSDYDNKKLYQNGCTKYKYDSLGRIKEETKIKDDKYHYLILEKSGKYREEIKEGGYATTSKTVYEYYDDGNLKARTYFFQGNISNQIQFVYKNNHIEKLFYLDTWGKKDKNDLKPTEVIFKYKFDKQKNWTEIVKNVDGKDLYKWVREIEYYK